uniref:Uncharacterized protein n=1 Tax=Coccidioides posadasii RMSCC 3488 TaxID=454284 RepID=A0A0J6F9V1_COCPO|nr:hypothetical protein CPAG_02380 [Coccidioides posadasii RMSCC 3488]
MSTYGQPISCAPHALIAILFPFVIKSARNPSDIRSVAEIRAMSCGVLDTSEQNAFWKLSYPIAMPAKSSIFRAEQANPGGVVIAMGGDDSGLLENGEDVTRRR